MRGSHQRQSGAQSRVMPISAVVMALLLGGGILLTSFFTISDDSRTDGACSEGVDLKVTAAPKLAEVLTGIVDRYRATSPEVDGRCVTITVTPRATPETVAQLATGWAERSDEPVFRRGPAHPRRPDTAPPDIWIPESATWLALARTSPDGARILPESGTTIATSPVVIAMPRPMAEAVGWPRARFGWKDLAANSGSDSTWPERGHPEWGRFRVSLADPASSSASLSTLLNIVSTARSITADNFTAGTFAGTPARLSLLTFERSTAAVPASTDSLLVGLGNADGRGEALTHLSAFPASESDVVAYNRGQPSGSGDGRTPKVGLAAFYPPDGLTVERIPFVLLEHAADDPFRARAAEDFLQALRGETGRNALAAAGFRDPDGRGPALAREAGVIAELPGPAQPDVPGAALAAAAKTFAGVHQRGATLVVLDTSGSMLAPVPGTGGTPKMRLAADAAVGALPLLADESELGLWHFATNVANGRDYAELVSTGPVGEIIDGVSRRDRVRDVIQHLAPDPNGNTGLYDTALAAFRKLSEDFVPGKANQVVLLTDGINYDPGSISLDDLLGTLGREFDADRPVRIITIAYGAEADPAALTRISAATGAKSYQAIDPINISRVIIDALLDQPGASDASDGQHVPAPGQRGPRR